MQFSELLKYQTQIERTPQTFTKCYYNLEEYHWQRILNASLIFAQIGIGPKVLSVEDHCITYEAVTPLTFERPPVDLDLTNQEIIARINKVVATMHLLGYGHGDLHIDNIGYDQEANFKILDLDTVYRIEEGAVPWLKEWMQDGFDWEDTFEDFVAYDYKNWKNNWLT